MAIERREQQAGTADDPDIIPMGNEVEVIPDPSREDQIREAAQILVLEEQILVDDEIDAPTSSAPVGDFNENLVDRLDQGELSSLSSDVLASIKADIESRSEWEKTFTDGLKYLGMKFDESRSNPFQGSTGVIHPILAEAVTQFQAQAYKELLPAKGPVKTEIVGARNAEVEAQAEARSGLHELLHHERDARVRS